MHRTTINLDEAVFLRVKSLAKRKGRSIARTIEDLLRGALASGSAAGAASRTAPPLYPGNGPRPGVDIADRDRLYDLMEGRTS